VNGAAEFEQFIQAISGELIEYSYRSTRAAKLVVISIHQPEYPADQSIPLHNEMAYSLSWPMKSFLCKGGTGRETPIADSRKVFERIDPKIRAIHSKEDHVCPKLWEGLDLQ